MRARDEGDPYLEALLPRVQAVRLARGLPPVKVSGHPPHAPVRVAQPLVVEVLAGDYAVCRLPAGAAVPPALLAAAFSGGGTGGTGGGGGGGGSLFSIAVTEAEVSLVCDGGTADAVASAPGARVQRCWRCLRVRGPLPFDAVGILATLAGALAAAGVPLFSQSTYDTDYVLVAERDLLAAVSALGAQGCVVIVGEWPRACWEAPPAAAASPPA